MKIRASKQINFDDNVDLNGKILTNAGTPSAASDIATVGYVNGIVTGLWDDRGNYNASGNSFPATGGSGTAGAILKGDTWTISVAGTLNSKTVDVGCTIRALQDTPGQTAENWAVLGINTGYVAENSANKVTSFSNPTDAQYPSAKLTNDSLANKVDKNNAIVGATKTKVTYDAKGLVTAGADATTADIADSTNKRYITDTQRTVLQNTSGTNSGNETTTTIGTLVSGATAKTTPDDADSIGLSDSAASNVIKKLTWASLKAALKTYFDTIYASATGGLAIANYVCRETPTGLKNGSNTTFALASTPQSGTEMVFLDGLLLEAGAGKDYTISGSTITLAVAPISTDVINVTYWK
jgi:hypothetical protein